MDTPLKGLQLVMISIALSAAAFMQVLDTSIANVALPYIAGDLGVSSTIGSWVITMFAVGNAISLPLTGWLSKRFGRVRVLTLSVLLFTLFSWACGTAWNFQLLVIFRFLQGCVAGPLIPLSQSIVVSCYPPEKRNFAMALFYMVIVVGPVCGPILGGWLTQDYSWPWIFNINIPVGIFATLTIWNILKDRESEVQKGKNDIFGLFLLVIGISFLQILLDKGEQYDWFRSPFICTFTVISAICLVLLVIWEFYTEHAILDLKLFKIPNFAIGTFIMAINYAIIFSSIVLTPLWLQLYMNYTAYWAGIAVAPMGLLPLFLSFPISKLMSKVRSEHILFSFFLTVGVCFYLTSFMTTAVSIWVVMLLRLFLGLALVQYFNPLTEFTLRHVPADKLTSASGMFHFFRIFAGGAATSLTIYLWDRRAILHYLRIGEFLTYFNPKTKGAIETLSSYAGSSKAGTEMLSIGLTNQSYVLATNDVFRLSAWICLAFLPLVAYLIFRQKNNSKTLIQRKFHD